MNKPYEDIFKNTSYIVKANSYHPNDIILKVGEIPDKLFEVYPLLKNWAFISTYNPLPHILSDEENKRRNEELEKLLKKQNYTLSNGVGVSDDGKWQEESFFIQNISIEKAAQLAHQYGQLAFLYGVQNEEAELLYTPSCIEQNKPIRAEKELLQLYFELCALSPQSNKWSNAFFAKNKPRLIRYQNFCTLSKALNVPCHDMNQFEWGDFIQQSHMQIWDEVMQLAIKNFEVKPVNFKGNLNKHPGVLASMFMQLLSNSKHLKKALGSSTIEASGYHQSYLQILANISKNIQPIEQNLLEILYLLLNPTKKQISKLELIVTFGYQDKDIRQIDIDWF